MASTTQRPRTRGASSFNPDALFTSWTQTPTLPVDNDLKTSIIKTFNLAHNDTYTYHAIASVTLSQVQEALNHSSSAGLHNWYRDEEGNPLPPPPPADITAYTSIFAPATTTTKALTTFLSNAKKHSLRASSASHLHSLRLRPTTPIPRCKAHINPYLDFWAWSCLNLEWCGPDARTGTMKTSHHVLPVFMHHFGCVVPSYEALVVVEQVARGREVVDVGSGNGYWTYMLRRQGVSVVAVDNLQSEWRTLWIGDTVVADGERFLRGRGEEVVLLLVYPIVGGEFTRKVVEAYKGDTVVVAGTQNASGYTAFRDRTIEGFMAERGWRKEVQIALPSFAGKDEGLFVFRRDV